MYVCMYIYIYIYIYICTYIHTYIDPYIHTYNISFILIIGDALTNSLVGTPFYLSPELCKGIHFFAQLFLPKNYFY